MLINAVEINRTLALRVRNQKVHRDIHRRLIDHHKLQTVIGKVTHCNEIDILKCRYIKMICRIRRTIYDIVYYISVPECIVSDQHV